MTTIADQPFQILLGLVQEHKLDPWDVDIEKIAGVYMQRVREMREFDIRISGRTLLSASVLLRMKSDFVFNGHKKPDAEEELKEMFDLDLPELGQITIIQRSPRKITLLDSFTDLVHIVLKTEVAREPSRGSKHSCPLEMSGLDEPQRGELFDVIVDSAAPYVGKSCLVDGLLVCDHGERLQSPPRELCFGHHPLQLRHVLLAEAE
ncbi:unnamed protein product, partial [marine sediment metagenome]